MSENSRWLDGLIGLASVGASLTGIAGFVVALVALFSGDLAAGGLCLIAAALSFGLLANSLLRK